jgi:hypothetical protein
MAVVEEVLGAVGLDPTGAVGSAIGLALFAVATVFVYERVKAK